MYIPAAIRLTVGVGEGTWVMSFRPVEEAAFSWGLVLERERMEHPMTQAQVEGHIRTLRDALDAYLTAPRHEKRPAR